MTKQALNSAKEVKRKLPQTPVKISYLLLLIAYGFVTVLTPNLNTLDSNGPKFLSLALLNLATYLFLFSRKEAKTHPEGYYAFFRNGIGIAYIGLMVVSLLSFFKAINVLESVLHFAKIFTTFTAAYLISILIITDKRNIKYLCLAMSVLVIFDSISVFSGIREFINGKLMSISDIMSVYSNKNILTSAIFVKIPFALWLMFYHRKWLRFIGITGTIFALTATFFLNARAFFLGSIALSIFLTFLFSIRYLQSRDKNFLKIIFVYLIILVASFSVFSVTQRYYYSNKSDQYAKSFGERMATIKVADGGGGRLELWNRSWQLFKDNPMLGVGLGNWKVAELKLENMTNPGYIYSYKSHNDFIEIATETGVFGGLLFLGIFLLAGWSLLKKLSNDPSSEKMEYLFLPVIGLLCYSFDAFFNFPQDRPEVQSLFAIFIGIFVSINCLFNSTKDHHHSIGNQGLSDAPTKTNRILRIFIHYFPRQLNVRSKSALLFVSLWLTVILYVLYINFLSLRMQRSAKEDPKFSLPSSMFVNQFPILPQITVECQPISMIQANYLYFEKKYNEMIKFLKSDKSSPYDSRHEKIIAFAFRDLNKLDSSIVHCKKALKLQPYNFSNINLMCELALLKGTQNECEPMLDEYLKYIKIDMDAWIYISKFYLNIGKLNKAVSVIDSALHYFPADSLVLKQNKSIHRRTLIAPYQALYDAASKAFEIKNFAEAIKLCSDLLIKKPNLSELMHYRAYSYYAVKEYAKSIQDINYLTSKGETKAVIMNLNNLIGSDYYALGNKEEACKNFRIAAEMGDNDGLNNYAKFCQGNAKN